MNYFKCFLLNIALISCQEGSWVTEKKVDDSDSAINTITLSCGEITGTVEIDGLSSLNGNTEVWLLNHTRGKIHKHSISKSMIFRFPCDVIHDQNIYSLHIVRNNRNIGDFDFSELLEGIQAGFSYEGGIGFDAGSIKISTDRLGDVFFHLTGFPARLGGGFRLLPEFKNSIAKFGQPGIFDEVKLDVRFESLSPMKIVDRYFRRDVYNYGISLKEDIFLRLNGKINDSSIRHIQAISGPRWFSISRSRDGFQSIYSSPYWSERFFEVAFDERDHFVQSSIFPGALVSIGDILEFRTYLSNGETTEFLRVVKEIVGLPPKVTDYFDDALGFRKLVDYDTHTENGLTVPFCQKGSIEFGLEPPRNMPSHARDSKYVGIGGDTRVSLRFAYFTESATERAELNVSASDFLFPYSMNYLFGGTGPINRAWHPDQITMYLTTIDGIYGPIRVVVPDGLLLDYVGGQSVHLIRINLEWIGSNDGVSAVSHIWLRKNCS